MIGIYLLITILTQLSPAQYPLPRWLPLISSSGIAISSIPGIVDFSGINSVTDQAYQLRTEFSALNGLTLGSPVLFLGRNIGSVESIDPACCSNNSGCSLPPGESSCFKVALELKAPKELLNQDQMIALITSRINVEQAAPIALVDLLPLDEKTSKKNHRADILPGYSSISEFWSR